MINANAKSGTAQQVLFDRCKQVSGTSTRKQFDG
ncbi:hypothetical protein CEXT_126451, partial [Caerostris extrusa]